MSWRPTAILLAAAAVFFVLVLLIERPIRQERLRLDQRGILPGFLPQSVSDVEVTVRGTNDIRVERSGKTNAAWRMTVPISYPARNASIEGLLESLTNLQWQQRLRPRDLKDMPDAQEKFGFAQPQFEISLQGSAGPHKILLGQSSALGDQVFLEVVGDPNIYLIGGALLQLLPHDKNEWRDPVFFPLAGLPFQGVQVRAPGRGFDLEQNPTNQLWFMTSPVKGRADSQRVNILLTFIELMRVREFVTDDPRADLDLYGLQTSAQAPELDVSFLRGTNVIGEFQAGSALTNYTNYVYARRAGSPGILIIDRDPLRPWQNSYTNFLDFHFISSPVSNIDSIVVNGEAGPFTVEKTGNGQWMVRAKENFPADATLMQEWLASFTNIQTQIEKTVATDFREYGLTQPLLQYTLKTRSGTAQSNAVLALIQFGAGRDGRIFESRPDESFVNAIAAGDFYRLPRTPWDLRDRRIWSFDSSNVLSLTIHQLGATRKFLRDPEGEWTFAPGTYGSPPNWMALEEGVHRLGDLRAVYWDGVGGGKERDFGFSKSNLMLTLQVRQDGKMEDKTIEFGGRSPYSYPYAAVTLDGQRLIFEFPVDLFDNFVRHEMTVPLARYLK